MLPDIRALLSAGRKELRRRHNERDKAKLGQFRIGSAGTVDEHGEIYGACHRKSYARLCGIDEPNDESDQIMWAAGEANEDTFQRVMDASGFDGKIVSSEALPVKSKIEGVTAEVLGSPDKILVDKDVKPLLGVELKGVFGGSTAVSVYYERKPKAENLIQAAAYSYFLGIPYVLVYTCANWISLNFYDQKRYKAKYIRPFDRVFFLEWRDGGKLWYRDETQEQWQPTEITGKGIEDYYRLLATMKDQKVLGPRATGHHPNGERAKYSPCGLCAFNDACDRYESHESHDEWVDEITVISALPKTTS